MRRATQVVVVLLAVAVAGGLLTVAVWRVRDAASRTQCSNNLKQWGLALHNYQDTFSRFPPAAMPNPELPPERRLSWIFSAVPFVEADTLYREVDKEKGWDAEENRFAAVLDYRVVICPVNREREPVSILTPSSYIGITGLGADAVSLSEGDARAGFFGYDRKLKSDDIRGRSEGILVALETSRLDGAWTAAGHPTARGLESGGPPYLGEGGAFGGSHRGGANALFADGSVRFLEASTDDRVLEAMAVVGGKPAGEE